MSIFGEEKSLNILQCFADFFRSKELAMKSCRTREDWEDHTLEDWELEYDFLFRGTDAGREILLWASAAKGDKVLLNQTTLDVIHCYNQYGYTPCEMEGNPPDYIGEQVRFIQYLTAGICHGILNGADLEALKEARHDFIQMFVLDTVNMVYTMVSKNTEFHGYRVMMELMLNFFIDLDGESEIELEPFYTGGIEFQDVKEKGLYPGKENDERKRINTGGINNCGGICVIRPEVESNCMLNIESDTSSNLPQIRACVRGRGYRKTFLNTGRLRYPMKRIGKRGEGKFKRISWDEAVEIMAKEWVRLKNEYGPGCRYLNYGTGVTGIMRPGNLIKRLMALDGGYLEYYNNYSAACTMYTTPYIYGNSLSGHSPADFLNTKLLILWGDNPAETIFGPERNYYISKVKEKGIKIICIDPRKNQTAVAYADEWIPIRPTTDSALADGMAYVIWTEGLHDQKFMDTYCLGFDEEHMPEGIPYGESYHSYLFGKKDGIVKTPEWAEEITGIPADKIRWLARTYAGAKPAALVTGYGPQRNGNGEQGVRSTAMLTCLTGNVGIPGGGAAGHGMFKEHNAPSLPDQPKNPYPASIPVFLWTKAIEHGTEMDEKHDHIKGAGHLDSNIKMIMNLAGNTLVNQHSDINDTIRILEDDTKCELIVCSDIFMTSSARYADLILPATSVFEGENMVQPWRGGNYILKNNQAIKPVFESRFEWEWMKELAAKLGLYEEFIDGKPEVDMWLRHAYRELSKKEPDLPDYDTFSEMGGYQYSEQVTYIAFEKEVNDPENHPFQTPSGKIEIFSERLYCMNEPEEIPAIPSYVPCPDGPGDPLKKMYPLQLVGWHTRRRCHSIHDNNEWMDEIEKPGVWIHPEDAKERGIQEGDLVEVYNGRGVTRVPAVVTTRIMKGVAAMSQGGWFKPDSKGVDTRGSINVLTSSRPTPLAKGNPQHTNLVEIRKYENV
ncbi:DMSO/selenate family reductase complex A subunit [Lacrimispora sp.]|uniref:DMSO/selenate family reductase complex A subunit n=1 Tax=Lacrimispora sp. TaxID=2719234 RepID=UPI0034608BFB